MTRAKTVSSVVLWSVISAAFIGPGTVTTAAASGSQFQLNLLWVVGFAAVGCLMLQEVSARLAIASGLTMGQALHKKYGEKRGLRLRYLLGLPVALGCAAYEAGNILGAVSGLNLMTSADTRVLTIGITLFAALILGSGKRNRIGWIMMVLVALMGLTFIGLAIQRPFSIQTYLSAAVKPTLPAGTELLSLALIGTTIVPYNLFLGSGISKGQTIPLMRIGLTLSVLIGGLITAAILVTGTAVTTFSTFDGLAEAMRATLGGLGAAALGAGLFAAGLSSAITAPYAASVIAASVFEWPPRYQKLSWVAVLLTGFAFGISGIKPVPVILAVQALNGLVLPLLTAYLILLVNDPMLISKKNAHPAFYNIPLVLVFGCVLLMGLNNVDKSIAAGLHTSENHFATVLTLGIALTAYLGYRILLSAQKR